MKKLMEVIFGGNRVFAASLLWEVARHDPDEPRFLIAADLFGSEQVLRQIAAAASGGMKEASLRTDGVEIPIVAGQDEPGVRYRLSRVEVPGGRTWRMQLVRMSALAPQVGDGAIVAHILFRERAEGVRKTWETLEKVLPLPIPEDARAGDRFLDWLRDEGMLTRCSGHGDLAGVAIRIDRDDIYERIAPALYGGEVQVQERKLVDFVRENSGALFRHIKQTARPFVVPDEAAKALAVADRLPEPLFNTQRRAVAAVAAAARSGQKGAFLVGEMGTGKTRMGIAAALEILRPGKLAIVMCPPQLVGKWEREILALAPNARVVRLEDWRATGLAHRIVRDARAGRLGDRPTFIIVGRNRARMSRRWKHAAVRRVALHERETEDGLAFRERVEAPACPRCGEIASSPVLDESGTTRMEPVRWSQFHASAMRWRCHSCGEPLWQVAREKPISSTEEMREAALRRYLTDLPRVGRKRADAVIQKYGVATLCAMLMDEQGAEIVAKDLAPRRWRVLVAEMQRRPFTATLPDEMPYATLKRAKGFVDVFIADEVHELKGEDTAQGIAFGVLSATARFTLAMTGTLLGGYAEDAFPLLFRLDPELMKLSGFGPKDAKAYQSAYGVLEEAKQLRHGEELRTAKGGGIKLRTKRKPGFAPDATVWHVLPRAVFVRLEDIQQEVAELGAKKGLRLLPSLREVNVGLCLEGEAAETYERIKHEYRSAIRSLPPSPASKSTHALLWMPDLPEQEFSCSWTNEAGCIQSMDFPALDPTGALTPKERELIKLVKRELADDRRVLVFCSYTGRHGVHRRLLRVLGDAGIKAAFLGAEVPTHEREAWVERKLREGVQVVITNPVCVMTGLDLYHFPTIAFFQPAASTYVVRQAARRAWRIGQKRPCRVYYFYYKGTAQETAIALMANKARVSLNTEGDLSESALDALADADDGLAAISRAIAGGKSPTVAGSISSVDAEVITGEWEADITRVPRPEELAQAARPKAAPAADKQPAAAPTAPEQAQKPLFRVEVVEKRVKRGGKTVEVKAAQLALF